MDSRSKAIEACDEKLDTGNFRIPASLGREPNTGRMQLRLTPLLLMIAASPLLAQDGTLPVGVVSHIKVTSDKVEDVSSLEAWKQSFIKPGMTDQQKALAIWQTVVKFRHQDIPPNEYLAVEAHVHDPIQVFNVYGYGQCCCAQRNIEMLARYIGLRYARVGLGGSQRAGGEDRRELVHV